MKIIRLQGYKEKEIGIHYEYDADSTPLGEGAMGCVFKGYRINPSLKERKPVAIKAIYDDIPNSVVERARREATIRIDNPYLLHMFGFIEQAFSVDYHGHTTNIMRYFVVMELLEGITLYDLIQGRTTDSHGMESSAIKKLYDSYIIDKYVTIQTIISKSLRGVSALHEDGYIHRDIDPSNIMITSDGHIKLIDFGICKKLDTLGTSDKNLTATGLFMGKVDYASPELIIGDVQHQNKTTDIYALGILLFQLCCGHLPYTGSDNEILLAHMRKKIPSRELNNCPFKKIILKATQKSQSARYNNANEMLEDIENVDIKKTKYKAAIISLFTALCVIICIIIGVVKFCSDPGKAHPPIEYNYRNLQKRLWSSDEEEVRNAFDELSKIANEKHDKDAMFEYGLSYSVGNKDFDMPTRRQQTLRIDTNTEIANYWLRRVIEEDPNNYRSIYWLLNNLIAKKQENEKSVVNNELLDLLDKFDKVTKDINDEIVNKYKESIKNMRDEVSTWTRHTSN